MQHDDDMRERWPPFLIEWNDETIRWYEDASAYTGFHGEMQALLEPLLGREETLADLGCGLGLIDLRLAGSVQSVTCLDASDAALEYLQGNARQQGIGNLHTCRTDAYTATGLWDTVMMSFFGRPDLHIRHYLSICRDKIMAIVREAPPLKAAYTPRKHNSVTNTQEAFDALGVRYTLTRHAMEFGQPFTSREEAVRYVGTYRKHPPDMEPEEYLAPRLMPIQHDRYAWYLPNLKRFGLFVVRKDENASL